MYCIAISVKGAEYMYRAKTAHRVSKASGQKIADALNEARYQLKDNEVWHVHEIDRYDFAYPFADAHAFKVYKGSIRRYTY